MARKRKKPQALKFTPQLEAAIRILQEVDGDTYNGYVEEILQAHVDKAAKITMEKTNVDLYAAAQKKCEEDESLKKYL